MLTKRETRRHPRPNYKCFIISQLVFDGFQQVWSWKNEFHWLHVAPFSPWVLSVNVDFTLWGKSSRVACLHVFSMAHALSSWTTVPGPGKFFSEWRRVQWCRPRSLAPQLGKDSQTSQHTPDGSQYQCGFIKQKIFVKLSPPKNMSEASNELIQTTPSPSKYSSSVPPPELQSPFL